MAKKAQEKVKVGSFVKIVHKEYRFYEYEGIVTESFSDMVQIYGDSERDGFGFHELNLDEHRISFLDKDKVRFRFDQAIRSIESGRLKAQIKFNNLCEELRDAQEKREKFFGASAEI